MTPSRPPFSALPLRPDGPPGNAWGLYGATDQLGTLNLLTPANTARAAAEEIRTGHRVPLDLPLDVLTPPGFNRQPLHHRIHHKEPRSVNDDILTFNTQSSTQWDGFRHYGYQNERLYYNGTTQEQIMTTSSMGMQAWVAHGGIVGRGVLLDYATWAADQVDGTQVLHPLQTSSITTATLDRIAAAQDTVIREGDILLIRTGWTEGYERLDAAERAAWAETYSHSAIGLESSLDTIRWLWDKGVAAVAGDQPAFEAMPFQSGDYSLHQWLLAGWGMPIGELFSLTRLARECRERRRWTFFFTSMPLHVNGGVASPPNSLAIF